MSNMFYNCFKLNSVDITSFDAGRVPKMNSMFHNCLELTYINLEQLITINVM